MSWELTVKGDPGALRWLTRGTADSTPRLVAVGEAYHLQWDGLEALTDVRDVEAAAKVHLNQLDGVASILLRRAAHLQLADVAFRRPDGKREMFVTLREVLHVGVTGEAELTVTGADGLPKRVLEDNPIPRIIALATTDEAIAKVLRLASGKLDNWAALYRLYEVLEHEAGGSSALATLTGTSMAKWQAFTAAANSPALTGDDARHGVQRGSAPRQGIGLSEAVHLLRHASRAWLIARATPGGPD